MIVIADTGPINYLIAIGEVAVLPKLFGTLIIPPANAEDAEGLRGRGRSKSARCGIASSPGTRTLRVETRGGFGIKFSSSSGSRKRFPLLRRPPDCSMNRLAEGAIMEGEGVITLRITGAELARDLRAVLEGIQRGTYVIVQREDRRRVTVIRAR